MSSSVERRKPLVTIHGAYVHFPIGEWSFAGSRRRVVHAVNGVSFEIPEGQTVGLVGESGSGKTTVGRAVARLLEPTEGTIRFDGQDVTHIRGTALSDYLPNVQVVFQDPFNSLNPRLTVGKIVEEPLAINRRGTRTERQKRVGELLEAVGISPTDADRMPADFSGGQRQRIAICRALALSPKLVVCDEAVSALDVSIQAKILNLLVDLQDRFALTYLFISHDLSVVRLVSDYIVVMYLGQVVETAAAEDVFSKPLHPYTKALMDAVPDLHKRQEMTAIPGEIPSNITPPIGCPFYSRCPKRMEICQENPPQLVEVEDGRYVACFLYHNEVDASRIGNGAGRRAKAGLAILQRRS